MKSWVKNVSRKVLKKYMYFKFCFKCHLALLKLLHIVRLSTIIVKGCKRYLNFRWTRRNFSRGKFLKYKTWIFHQRRRLYSHLLFVSPPSQIYHRNRICFYSKCFSFQLQKNSSSCFKVNTLQAMARIKGQKILEH